jgi:hypothetical protein
LGAIEAEPEQPSGQDNGPWKSDSESTDLVKMRLAGESRYEGKEFSYPGPTHIQLPTFQVEDF